MGPFPQGQIFPQVAALRATEFVVVPIMSEEEDTPLHHGHTADLGQGEGQATADQTVRVLDQPAGGELLGAVAGEDAAEGLRTAVLAK